MCPFCREPSNLAEDDDIALAYFAQLDILLKAAAPMLANSCFHSLVGVFGSDDHVHKVRSDGTLTDA